MKIGVMSDSHDHLINIEKAALLLIAEKVEKVIHCGDMVAPFIKRALMPLKEKNISMIGIYGNNDGERLGIHKILGEIMPIKGDFHEDSWDNKNIAIYHGTDVRLLDALIESQKYDLILTGHTHQIRIEKKGKTLILNPGETCGYLTGKATCAVIDTGKNLLNVDDVKIIEIVI